MLFEDILTFFIRQKKQAVSKKKFPMQNTTEEIKRQILGETFSNTKKARSLITDLAVG